MREQAKVEKWVVYETVSGPNAGRKSVCTTGEWQAIQQGTPNLTQLIRDNITDEGEAEKLARGTSGDQVPRQTKARRSAFGKPDEQSASQ